MKNWSKLTAFALSGILTAQLCSGPVFAETPGEKLQNRFQEVKSRLQELKDKVGSRPGLLRNFFGKAAIGSGTLAAKNGTTLTVTTKEGKSVTVLTDEKTKLRRRFWGKATLDEMQIGDTLNVIGKWTDETKTTIQARLIRDVSIQKRRGVFIGTVESLTGDGFVLKTNHRGSQAVILSSTTKLINRKNQPITKTDIAVGHKVRVLGLWNNKNNTITEVAHVKDFSLPVVVTKVAPTTTQ